MVFLVLKMGLTNLLTQVIPIFREKPKNHEVRKCFLKFRPLFLKTYISGFVRFFSSLVFMQSTFLVVLCIYKVHVSDEAFFLVTIILEGACTHNSVWNIYLHLQKTHGHQTRHVAHHMTLWSRDQHEVFWQFEKYVSPLSQDLWLLWPLFLLFLVIVFGPTFKRFLYMIYRLLPKTLVTSIGLISLDTLKKSLLKECLAR